MTLHLPGFEPPIPIEYFALKRPDIIESKAAPGVVLRPYQTEAIEKIRAALNEYRSTLYVACTGSGKCLGLGTPVLRADGRVVPAESVLPGDRLMGPDGNPRNVMSVSRGHGPLVRIVPLDYGQPWVCNDVHILTLIHSETHEIIDISVNDFLDKPDDFKRPYELFRVAVGWFRSEAALLDAATQYHIFARADFAIDRIGDGQYFGFTLDGDGRFLLGDFTVTHNTSVASEVVRAWPGRVLWLAHRDELIQQAAERLRTMTGEFVDREQAECRAGTKSRIVVASVQTLCRESRMTQFKPDDFGLIVADECHHSVSDSWQSILQYFANAKLLGLTATPDRSDRLALGKIFDSVAMIYDIETAIKDGWLCPIELRSILLDVDLSGIKTTAGDLNSGQLNDAMSQAKALEGVARPTFELAGDRQTLVFSTGVENAHKTAALLNEYRRGCAKAVDGSTEITERRAIFAGYAKREFQYLVNVQVAAEGYDDPGTSCISMGRPTKSRSLYTQILGRGLRTYPGKETCLVLDFAGNAGRHCLVSPVDILGGKYTDEEVALAKKIISKRRTASPAVALAMAHEEIEARAKRKVAYRAQACNPFAVANFRDDNNLDRQFGRRDPAPWQIERLKKFGLDIPDGCSFRQASQMLDVAFRRIKKGLASHKQLKLLRSKGFMDPNIKFRQASELISAIFSNRGRLPAPSVVDSIVNRERIPGED